MADVGADPRLAAGAAEADLGVHVGAVHVDLAAVGVDDAADVLDGFFEDAVGGGIGDHDAGEVLAVLRGLFFEVGDVDVALRIAGDGDDFEAGGDGGGGVCSMRTGWYQADIPWRVWR